MTDEPIRYKISDKIWHRISDAFNKAAAFIHRKGEYKAEYLTDKEVKPLIDETYKAFTEAIDYGLKDNEIPTAMRMYLQDNVFVFSGFKTHTELRQASALLRDASGQIKPFNRFLTDIQKIDKDYNKTYLQAEYNFAVASSQAAARWQEFAADGDDFLLQYRTAKDEKVREQHRLLDGITLPPSDKFWDEYFVPLGWNCRCSVVQVNPRRYPQSDSEEALQRGRAATFQPNAKGQNKAQIFRFNSGKQKVVFPPKHPYFKGTEQSAIQTITDFGKKHSVSEASAFAKSYVGKIFYTNQELFANRKVALSSKSAKELIRGRGAAVPERTLDVLDHINYYLDNPLTITEQPKHHIDAIERMVILRKEYSGGLAQMKGGIVEIVIREMKNNDLRFHYIRAFTPEEWEAELKRRAENQ